MPEQRLNPELSLIMQSIRPEQPGDREIVRQVHEEAFSGEGEARLVDQLRADPQFIPELSLVAECNHEVIGHILFFPVSIAATAGPVPALSLAPLGIRTAYQRKGVGSALTWHGLSECTRLGHRMVICVGHPQFYQRFGFVPARAPGLELPFPAPDEVFLVRELVQDAMKGVTGIVRYPDAFSAVTDV
jgi:putative acetyltransferase